MTNTSPTLRFKNFDDEWKRVRLSEILNERNVQLIPSEDIPLVSFTVEKGVTPKTDRYNREFLVRDNNKKYKLTELDDIVYNPANLKFGAISKNTYGKALFSPIYVTYEVGKEFNPDYIASILMQYRFIQQALRYQEGTVYERMAVKSDDFLKLNISLPNSKEQFSIGTLFQTLDELLAAYKDNLANYQVFKASMLSKMFPKAGKTTPEIRLDGFDGEWEVDILKKLATFSKGNGYTKGDLVEVGSPIILYGQLYINYQTVISDPSTYVTTMKDNSVLSDGGEVIVPASGESAEDISRASVVKNPGIVLGGDLNIIKVNQNIINPVFLALTISNGSQQRELIKRAQGKSVVHLRNNDLEKVLLTFPSLEEQQTIGSFFSNLDELISTYQEKIDQLEILKKKLLQDMFV